MWKNLKIAKKLILSFLIITFIAGISGLVAINMLNKITADYEDALVNFGFSQGDIGVVLTQLADSRRCIRDIINYSGDPQIVAKATSDMNQGEQIAMEKLAELEETTITEDGKKIYAEILVLVQKYQAERDRIIALGNTTDPVATAQAHTLCVTELDPIYQNLYDAIQDFLQIKVNGGNQVNQTLMGLSKWMLAFISTLLLVSFVASMLLGTGIARGISKPLQACAKRLEGLARGDLQSPVPTVDREDEVGKMALATGKIVSDLKEIIRDESRLLGLLASGDLTGEPKAKYPGDFHALETSIVAITSALTETVGQIGEASSQVYSSANLMSSGANQLSQGVSEQADSVEELAQTIQDISQQVEENALHAQQANDMAQMVGGQLMQSNEQMSEMLDAMKDISDSSSQIGKIIKAIEDIAFQTNILALNAAVEAARAGAAGKGFAVVADEVRNLAGKSAEASKSTGDLIENSIRTVQRGEKLANETAASLLQTVDGAREVTNLIGKISQASNAQANSVSQVTQGVKQISNVVQMNSATAEQTAATSELLSGQSQMLEGLVRGFKRKEHSKELV